MNRTRKWDFVAQEARRLAALGLNAAQIARRLDLNKSTVTRWFKAGKFDARDGVAPSSGLTTAKAPMSPQEWSTHIRSTFQLDATDDQLVTIAESMLRDSLDASATSTSRANAAGRYQSLVKQLMLKAPLWAEQPKPEPQRPKAAPRAPRSGVDPRNVLKAV